MKKRQKSKNGLAKRNAAKVDTLTLKRAIKHAKEEARGYAKEHNLKRFAKLQRKLIHEAKAKLLDWDRPKHKVPRFTGQECAKYLLSNGWTKGKESWMKPHPQGSNTIYKTLRKAVKSQRWLAANYGH